MAFIIDKKERIEFFTKQGRREGELDFLAATGWNTLEDRAERACTTLGLITYRKYFIKGYKEAANGSKYVK